MTKWKWYSRLQASDEGIRFLVFLGSVLAILFAIALAGYLTGRWDRAEGQALPPSKWDKRIAELDREAIEQAYKERVNHLFQVWMKDDTDQPRRALVGTRNARKAFIAAMIEIEKVDGASQP